MYVLRDENGRLHCSAENEDDLWTGLMPMIPWPNIDVDKTMEWVKASHLERGWTVTKED